MDFPESDPERLTVLYVQQWLSEQGFLSALKALEKDSGIVYDETKLNEGAKLMQLVWRDMEAVLAADVDDAAAERLAEEERLLRGGCEDYVSEIATCLEGVHPSSVTCVRIWPGRDVLLTGSGGGHVRLMDFEADVKWECKVGTGGVLCLDLVEISNDIGRLAYLLAVGSMDGSVSILQPERGEILASNRAHSKYVVRVLWAKSDAEGGSNGHLVLVTASHDQSVGVFSWESTEASGTELRSSAEPTAQIGGEVHTLVEIKKVPYMTPVQDILLMPDGHTLVVAVKAAHCLRLLDIHKIKDLGDERLINMNEAGDNHISFTARHLALSPDGKYLLVSTDTARLLILRTCDWSVLRSLFATSEQFHNPVATWHRDSFYVYVATTTAEVWAFHVGSGKVVSKLAAHKINVRDMNYDASRNLLATCSFDKSVRIFRSTGH
ncbi:hypothetical protein CEUSTIGMA_g6595.t1 [Chlamydomonas eustigma]|uniref:Uncharacterized protein n=1 Tax=Chlamydomonas eustigma TaxID=1157962 RepID=A0A250X7W4_9CHLO|nr:hypothetical protein CEUSTIGMA_g6595.t1 [Chlamydomonas eustigma]|eukprot:GAX79155.1 hypothetical protein CEUSTIGMA_g6595.t1 [Chlamydomonas eustigma]